MRVPVASVAPSGVNELAAEIFVPPSSAHRGDTVVCCFPGGGMSRRYFDIPAPADAGEYSMARYLARKGRLVVTVDHPGVGDSDRPDDGYALSPDVVAAVDAHAVAWLKGHLATELPGSGAARWIGLGHSMGGKLTIQQQARHRPFDAIVLLGTGGRGLAVPRPVPEEGWLSTGSRAVLSDDILRYADDPEAFRRDLPALAKKQYGDNPLPAGTTATSELLLAGMDVPPAVLDAITASSTTLLALCGLSSMVPGSTAPEMAAIDVPVFLGLGGRDIAGPPHDLPAAFSSSPDVTLFVLAGAGHNHNVAPNRTELWDRIDGWIGATAP